MNILQSLSIFLVGIVLAQENLMGFEECIKELDLETPDIGDGSFIQWLLKFLAEDKNKCLAKCRLEKLGLLDDDGNYDKTREKIEIAPEDEKSVDGCIDKYSEVEDDCERHRDFYVCVIEDAIK